MKKLYLLSILTLTTIALIYSCSAEEEDTTPPPSVVATPEPEPPAPTQYTLTVTAGEGGSVSTEGGTYDEGTEVTITATANEGYEFVGWEGSDSDSKSLIITLNADVNFQAIFGLKYKSFLINIDHPQSQEMIQNFGITSNSNVMFKKNGVVHLISHPANPRGQFESLLPTVHLIKENDAFSISDFYNIGISFGGRDENLINQNNDYLFSDHGTEVWLGGGEGTPFNNIWVAKNINSDNIEWVKVNQHRSFYHDASTGDLNGDGLYDVVAIHMSTNSDEDLDRIYYHTFLQNIDGSFSQSYETIKFYGFQKPSYMCYNNPNFDDISNCTGIVRGSVLIQDIDGDNKPEIIGGAYTHNPLWDTPAEVENSFEIFSDPDEDGIYEKLHFLPRMGWMKKEAIGSDEIKAYDYDNDGDEDLFVGLEGNYDGPYTGTADFNGLQIFDNNGSGEFTFSGHEIPFFDVRLARFDLLDIDQDGDLDIVFSGQLFTDCGTNGGAETSFYYNNQNALFKSLVRNENDQNWLDTLIDFDQLIYYNENGTFLKKDNGNKVLIKRGKSSVEYYPGKGIETVNPAIIDNELIFYLYKTDIDQTNNFTLELIEFKPNTIEQ